MTLWFSFDAIAFMQACVEPLRRIGYAHLVKDGINQFFVKDLCIVKAGEITVTFSPHTPAICHAMCNLFYRCLATQRTVGLRHTGLSEIFLGKDVSSDLAPLFWNLHVVHFEY